MNELLVTCYHSNVQENDACVCKYIQCFLLLEGGLENPENGSEGESLSSP